MKTILVDAVDGLVIRTKNGFELFREMYDLLEAFPNQKVVVTGADDEQYRAFNLAAVPYDVFTLKHHPEKTDPKYFEILLQHFGLKNDEVVYFEHNPEAVKSADSVGIVSYHYDHEKRDIKALKTFLEKNI